MVQGWRHWSWRFGLVSVAMGGVIASDCVLAQITPDDTLGTESSVVTITPSSAQPRGASVKPIANLCNDI